jgi:hypothetical protein
MPGIRKSKIILNLKKYSNVILFSRREKERSLKINISNKSVKDYIIKKKNKNQRDKSNDVSNPSDDISTFALQTISSFKNSNSFSTQITFPKNIRPSLIDKENRNTPHLTISNFYSQASKDIKNKHKKKTNIFCLTQNNITLNKNRDLSNNERCNTINFFPKKSNFSFKEKENEINLLKRIKIEHGKENYKTDEKNLIYLKLKKLESEKYNISLMLNKVREFKYFNYLNEQKKEINIITMENSKNNIEFLKDKINSLNKIKNIYSNKISNTLGEYSKFISNYKEKEKINSDILLNQINNIKKEVKNLQNKIAKKEQEKATILKWVYFLIKMKEKKIELPTYYKKIIETNFPRGIEKRKTIAPKLEDIKSIKEKKKQFFEHHEHNDNDIDKDKDKDKLHKDHSNKTLAHIRLSAVEENVKNGVNDKKTHIESKFKRKSKIVSKGTISFKKSLIKLNFIKFTGINSGHSTNLEESIEANIKLKSAYDKLINDGIDPSEINRISKYKLFLIYKTPEDLEDRLIEFQNENIQLLRQYELTRKKLIDKRLKYKTIFENRANSIYEELDEKIKQNEIRLNQVKNKNELLLIQCAIATNRLKAQKKVVNIKQKKSKSLKKKIITQESIRRELFVKIENLYELCLNHFEKPNKFLEYKDKFKKDIIYMLTVIELFIVYLKSKLNFNDKSDILKFDLMKRIKNEIEHKHKIEKGEILRLKEKEKFKYLQEIIEEKTNKILFLQKRRIIPVYNWDKMKKDRKYSFSEKKLNFEDFMFD